MKVPLSWLADYVPLRLPPAEVAHRLTMAGVETAFVPGVGAAWGEHVVVGRVVEVKRHPNADRLRLATVDLGTEALTVVCGAPNVAEGQRIAFAKVGARLMDGHTGEPMTLAAAVIRGVTSPGMVCSERELGLGDGHEGTIVLPEDAPVGAPLADYLAEGLVGSEGWHLAGAHFAVEPTTNRGDCLSVLGLAHEVGAITATAITEPQAAYEERGGPVGDAVRVRIEAPDLCARYTATVVRGVRVGQSPQWLQRRLRQAGMRPINNVVDVTNYVMLEYGQPLHAFDLHQVRQGTIVVRQARHDERFTTLDGLERTLQPPMLLIADPERAIGLAGVMGGANSEMTDTTTDVLVESATFNATNTRRTAQALRLRSEASARFEKGLNPELAMRAVRRATALILATAGGTAAHGVADAFPGAAPARHITLTRSGMRALLGVAFPAAQVRRVLDALGFACSPAPRGALRVTPPYWRTDVTIEEDVIEEVARVVGYDRVPDAPLGGRVPAQLPSHGRDLRERVKDLLADAGMQETISYSLVSERLLRQVMAFDEGGPPLRAANPMSRDQELLRTTLRGSILRTAAGALRLPAGAARLFEAGRVYLPREGQLPEEREMVVGVLAGPRGDGLWAQGQPALDFYDAKGVVEALLHRLGVTADYEPAADPFLHPGRAARTSAGGQPVGVVGELHPDVMRAFDLAPERVAFFELDLDALSRLRAGDTGVAYRPFARFPAATRDIALVVGTDVPAEQIAAAARAHPLVRQVVLFDLFAGQFAEPGAARPGGLPMGKKSLAYRLELQSDEATLSAEQVNEAIAVILDRIRRETGAVLRT